MPFDHEATRLHRAELDREIEAIRRETDLAANERTSPGVVGRARRRAGTALIAAGLALIGSDRSALRPRRA